MDLEQAIQKNRIIEIKFSSSQRATYSGVCLKANKYVWLIVNYDFKRKMFDGFSVVRNKDIESYAVYKNNSLDIRINNLIDFLDVLPLNKVNTFYSALKEAKNKGLVAIFIGGNDKSYYVGKILSVSRQKVQTRLIDKKGYWSKTKKFKIADIDFFSFLTRYETGLLKMVEKRASK